jgi:hypothetical protein
MCEGMPTTRSFRALAGLAGFLLIGGCAGDAIVQDAPDASVKAADGMPAPLDLGLAADAPSSDGVAPPDGAPPPPKPSSVAPCKTGRCWSATALSGLCGASIVNEDFSSGKYNVRTYALSPKVGVKVDLKLAATSGSWKPALILHDAAGATVYDGELGLTSAALSVQPVASGKAGSPAKLRLTAHKQAALLVHVSGWSVIQGGFAPSLPTTAKYQLTVTSGCPPPKPGTLLSPPNFDPKNVAKGYYLLPQSQPPGLYTRKADGCSRGTKLLIDVLYTVAYHWKQKWPSLSPIAFLDLNEGPCSSVNHQTHDDGTHADLTAGCATQVSCTNNQPAIDLAKLFVDTGQVCGIINNDTAVQAAVNTYFKSKYTYKPWHGTFMRSVSGHTHHFHVRVKKPDGSCN